MSLDTLASIVTNTPVWAWAVLALLVFVGVRQLSDRTMSWTRLIIMPAVVLALAVSGLLATGATLAALLGLAVGAAAGSVAAAVAEQRDRAVQVKRGQVQVRGEWLTLVVLVGAFLTRYISIVIGTLDPAATGATAFQLIVMSATGLFASFTLVRAALRLRVAFS